MKPVRQMHKLIFSDIKEEALKEEGYDLEHLKRISLELCEDPSWVAAIEKVLKCSVKSFEDQYSKINRESNSEDKKSAVELCCESASSTAFNVLCEMWEDEGKAKYPKEWMVIVDIYAAGMAYAVIPRLATIAIELLEELQNKPLDELKWRVDE